MISVIIPAHNESENIAGLLQEIHAVMNPLGKSWEVIVVDDASTDGMWEKLIALRTLPLRILRLKKQSGQTAALAMGFKKARGTIFITLDGDGQNNPHDIPKLLEKLSSFDCVCGYREKRCDTLLKRIISKIANTIRRWVLGDDIIDTGCSLRAFKKDCLENMCFFKGAHRFFASFFLMNGFSLTQVPVSHRPRTQGKSHYSLFNRGFSVVTDLLAVRWMKRRHVSAEVEAIFPHDS